MTTPLQVLILSQDSTLLGTSGVIPSDTRRRHIRYADMFQARYPGSRLRIVAYTPGGQGTVFERIGSNLELYGTGSKHRALFLIDVWRLLARFHSENWRPNLVTAQTPWEEGLAGLAFARRWRVPFLVQLHSDFYGQGFRSERYVHGVLYRVARAVVRRSSHVRAVSDGIRDEIVAAKDACASRVSVVPVPVDFTPVPHLFYSSAASWMAHSKSSPPTVLFVGRLVPQKDLNLWLQVAALVNRDLPHVKFVIAGNGPERHAHESRANRDGLNVTFLGDVDHRELPKLYAQASALLLTSTHEGLGRVIVEAMLAGVPVISTDIVGPRDLIVDGQTGRLVGNRSADSLAAAVVEAITIPEKALAFSLAGRAWAEDHFGFEATTKLLTDMWAATAAGQA